MGAGAALLFHLGLVTGCGSDGKASLAANDGGFDDAARGDGAAGDRTFSDLAPPMGCPLPQPSYSVAVHIVVDVTWAGSMAVVQGAGKIHLWNKTALTFNGNSVTGSAQACGTILPEVSLSGAATIAAGGSRLLVEVPDAIWEGPNGPRFPVQGTQSSSGVGASVELQWTAALGVKLDPGAPWPASYQGLTTVDVDGDGHPGYSVRPVATAGYVLPPVSLAVGSQSVADLIYLASRDFMVLTGTRVGCWQQSGKVDVTMFDGHIVGCHIKGGADCTAAQTDFMDQNRVRYLVKSATFESRRVEDDATCAEIREAMPPG
jgi:hypothetical protein